MAKAQENAENTTDILPSIAEGIVLEINDSNKKSSGFLYQLQEKLTYDTNKKKAPGKEYDPEETASYWLPKDEDEQQRLTGQHFAIKELFGGNFLPKVHEVIDFSKDIKILDVGCGSGIWIMDMVADYPNCSYDGCDIIDLRYKNIELSKVKYSFGNVAEGLNYPDNYFDFVHMRLLVLALRKEEWPLAIKELLRVTKPGGVIHLLEVNIKKSGGLAAQKFMEGINLVCELRGQDAQVHDRLEELVTEVGENKIIQSEAHSVDLSSGSSVSKKFRWDWELAAAGSVPLMGPMVGLNTKEEQERFLEDLHEDYLTTHPFFYMKAVAAQKNSS